MNDKHKYSCRLLVLIDFFLKQGRDIEDVIKNSNSAFAKEIRFLLSETHEITVFTDLKTAQDIPLPYEVEFSLANAGDCDDLMERYKQQEINKGIKYINHLQENQSPNFIYSLTSS
jgi:hypothetical protein